MSTCCTIDIEVAIRRAKTVLVIFITTIFITIVYLIIKESLELNSFASYKMNTSDKPIRIFIVHILR